MIFVGNAERRRASSGIQHVDDAYSGQLFVPQSRTLCSPRCVDLLIFKHTGPPLSVVSTISVLFHIPWDLHPLSLHAEFSHNTDLIAVHTSSNHTSNSNGHSSRNNGEADIGPWMMQSAGEVGLRADDGGRTGLGGVGLGGSICRDVMHAGSMLEVVGRLCLPHARASAIARAAAHSERGRSFEASRAYHQERLAEAAQSAQPDP